MNEENEAYEERAAIMEFDGGLSRDEAENRAREIFNPPEPTAPYVPGSQTSREAAESFGPADLNSMQTQVLRYIESKRWVGATCDEIEAAIGMRHQTCSARIRDLTKRDLIKNSGRQRKTRSGRNAVVHVGYSIGTASSSSVPT